MIGVGTMPATSHSRVYGPKLFDLRMQMRRGEQIPLYRLLEESLSRQLARYVYKPHIPASTPRANTFPQLSRAMTEHLTANETPNIKPFTARR
jgi:hypothetical protein